MGIKKISLIKVLKIIKELKIKKGVFKKAVIVSLFLLNVKTENLKEPNTKVYIFFSTNFLTLSFSTKSQSK